MIIELTDRNNHIKLNLMEGTGSYGLLVTDKSIRASKVGDYLDNAVKAYKKGYYSEFFARSYTLMIRIMKLIINLDSNNPSEFDNYGYITNSEEKKIMKDFRKTIYYRNKSTDNKWLVIYNQFWDARNDFVHQLEPFLFSSYARDKTTGKLDKKRTIEPSFANRKKIRDWCINEIKNSMNSYLKNEDYNAWKSIYLKLLGKRLIEKTP